MTTASPHALHLSAAPSTRVIGFEAADSAAQSPEGGHEEHTRPCAESQDHISLTKTQSAILMLGDLTRTSTEELQHIKNEYVTPTEAPSKDAVLTPSRTHGLSMQQPRPPSTPPLRATSPRPPSPSSSRKPSSPTVRPPSTPLKERGRSPRPGSASGRSSPVPHPPSTPLNERGRSPRPGEPGSANGRLKTSQVRPGGAFASPQVSSSARTRRALPLIARRTEEEAGEGHASHVIVSSDVSATADTGVELGATEKKISVNPFAELGGLIRESACVLQPDKAHFAQAPPEAPGDDVHYCSGKRLKLEAETEAHHSSNAAVMFEAPAADEDADLVAATPEEISATAVTTCDSYLIAQAAATAERVPQNAHMAGALDSDQVFSGKSRGSSCEESWPRDIHDTEAESETRAEMPPIARSTNPFEEIARADAASSEEEFRVAAITNPFSDAAVASEGAVGETVPPCTASHDVSHDFDLSVHDGGAERTAIAESKFFVPAAAAALRGNLSRMEPPLLAESAPGPDSRQARSGDDPCGADGGTSGVRRAGGGVMPGVPVLTLGAGGADSGVAGGVEGHAACEQGDEADGSGGCVGGGVGGDPEHREALARLDTARSGRLQSMLHRYLVCMSCANKPKADTGTHTNSTLAGLSDCNTDLSQTTTPRAAAARRQAPPSSGSELHRAARARDEGTESLGVGGNGKGALNEELDSDLDLLREQQVPCVFLFVSRGPVSVSGPESRLALTRASALAPPTNTHALAPTHAPTHTSLSTRR